MRVRDTRCKLKQAMFSWNIRKHFLTMSTVKHRSKLPRDVMQILSLEDFRTRLNKALSEMV